jgi:mono/diheme cytochrome c family protein
MRRHCVRVGLVALAASFVFAQAQGASPEKGKIGFTKYGCWQCHGTLGQGGIASGGKVLTDTPLPYEGFAAFVRTTNRAMPPYREQVLPDEDLADIYAYLKSIPKPADYKTIPLLNQ